MSCQKRIEELVICGSGQSFKGGDFRDLLRPGVYILIENGVVLYVGQSKRMMARMSGKHHKNELFMRADEIRVYPCRTAKDAYELERILIDRLKPTHNVNRRLAYLAKILGVKHPHLLSQPSQAYATLTTSLS